MFSGNNRDSRGRFVVSVTPEAEKFISQSFGFSALFTIGEFFVEGAFVEKGQLVTKNASIEWQLISEFSQQQKNLVSGMINSQINAMKAKIETRMNARMNDMLRQFVDMFNLQQNTNTVMRSVSQAVEHINFASSNSSAFFAPLVSSGSSDSSASSNSSAFFASPASLDSSASSDSFTSSAKQLRAENVRYFDSEIKQKNEKSRSLLALIVSVNKHVYYINVYIFVDRLKDLIKSHGVELVINVFIFCFRDGALM